MCALYANDITASKYCSKHTTNTYERKTRSYEKKVTLEYGVKVDISGMLFRCSADSEEQADGFVETLVKYSRIDRSFDRVYALSKLICASCANSMNTNRFEDLISAHTGGKI